MDLALIGSASTARRQAYAPYSGFDVGAAIRDENGQIHVGCNVENASYGATICAERSAVARMVSEGGSRVEAIAVVTEDGSPPCGICLQTLLEFAPFPEKVEVLIGSAAGNNEAYTLAELLPFGFGRSDKD